MRYDRAEQSPGAPAFAQASYTLRVFDERGPTALASPGRFSGANAVAIFAMYSPAAYTPLAQGSSRLSELETTNAESRWRCRMDLCSLYIIRTIIERGAIAPASDRVARDGGDGAHRRSRSFRSLILWTILCCYVHYAWLSVFSLGHSLAFLRRCRFLLRS